MKKILLFSILLPFLSKGQLINTIVGNGVAAYSGDGGQATAASISAPSGLSIDASGNLYVAEYYNHTIRKISPSGIITTIAGNGVSGSGGDGGPATNAQLWNPVKIYIDLGGNIYIADKLNNRIRKISPAGIINTFAGTGVIGYSGDGGAATAAKLNHPTGVTGDISGNIYIGDDGNFVVRKVTSAGIITTFAGNGLAGSSGDGGPATAANLAGAYSVNLDAAGNLYVCDPPGNKIRKINTSGIISTFAGTGVSGYSGDGGQATAAQLSNVAGIVFDNMGNAFIDDMFNGRIRKVSTSEIITTVAGNGTIGYSGDGGPASAAELHWSTELYFDPSGNLLITDNNNNRVRKILNCISAPTQQPVNDTVSVSDTAIFYVTTSVPSSSYQWQENSGAGFVDLTNVLPYSGVNTDTLHIDNVIMLFNTTHYRCVISNEVPCTDTSNAAMLIVQDRTGIQQYLSVDLINIYPNPAHDNIFIKIPYITPAVNIQLINEIGQPLSEQNVTGNTANIDLGKLPPGMYILRIQSDGQVIYKKIFKE